ADAIMRSAASSARRACPPSTVRVRDEAARELQGHHDLTLVRVGELLYCFTLSHGHPAVGVGVAVFRVRAPIRDTGRAGHGHGHARGPRRIADYFVELARTTSP